MDQTSPPSEQDNCFCTSNNSFIKMIVFIISWLIRSFSLLTKLYVNKTLLNNLTDLKINILTDFCFVL